MTIQVTLPDSLAAQARELATREHITVDALVASALTTGLIAAVFSTLVQSLPGGTRSAAPAPEPPPSPA